MTPTPDQLAPDRIEELVRRLYEEWYGSPRFDPRPPGVIRATIIATLELAAEIPWETRFCYGTKELRDEIEHAIRSLAESAKTSGGG